MKPPPDPSRSVVTLTPADAPAVVATLCDAFRDYPVMRFVLDADGTPERLETLIGFFVQARVLNEDVLFGIRDESGLSAVATTSDPGRTEVPAGLEPAREACWGTLGAAARKRYERCGEIWKQFTIDVPHIHLNMIGVRAAGQGTGQGRRLLDRVHRLSRETPGSRGVSLTTELPGNVPLYEHVGYRVTARARIAPELETWSLFRPDDP